MDFFAFITSCGNAQDVPPSPAPSNGSNAQTAPTTKIAIELQHPVVVVPRSSVSGEAFVVDLVSPLPYLTIIQ